MRTINELLKITLENFDEYFSSYNNGICLIILVLWAHEDIITFSEYRKIYKYIYENKPFSIFRIGANSYFWRPGRVAPRKRWLKKHVKKTRR